MTIKSKLKILKSMGWPDPELGEDANNVLADGLLMLWAIGHKDARRQRKKPKAPKSTRGRG